MALPLPLDVNHKLLNPAATLQESDLVEEVIILHCMILLYEANVAAAMIILHDKSKNFARKFMQENARMVYILKCDSLILINS